MPECLRRFDWREWRPPALPDDPFPHYSEWIMGYRDFSDARDAWIAGESVVLPPERPLPDPIPYTGLLPPIGGSQGQSSYVPAEHQARPIATNHKKRRY